MSVLPPKATFHSVVWARSRSSDLPGLRVWRCGTGELCHAPQGPIQSLLRSRRPCFSVRRVRHHGVAYFGGSWRWRLADRLEPSASIL